MYAIDSRGGDRWQIDGRNAQLFNQAVPTNGQVLVYNGTTKQAEFGTLGLASIPGDTLGKVLIAQGPGVAPIWSASLNSVTIGDVTPAPGDFTVLGIKPTTASKKIRIGVDSNFNTYGAISFNDDLTDAGMLGFIGAGSGDNNLYYYVPTGWAHQFLVGGAGPYLIVTAAQVSTTRPVRFSNYGSGTATFDSSGNISSVSDARAKDNITPFTKGLAVNRQLQPNSWTWKIATGLVNDDINVGHIAQDLLAAGLPEAVFTYRTVDDMEEVVTEVLIGADGAELTGAESPEVLAAATLGEPRIESRPKLDDQGRVLSKRVPADRYTVSDRAILALHTNCINELDARVTALEQAAA